jgi:hypothetical protein
MAKSKVYSARLKPFQVNSIGLIRIFNGMGANEIENGEWGSKLLIPLPIPHPLLLL